MKQFYFKGLSLFIMLGAFISTIQAQTYVTVYSDNFEDYSDKTDLSRKGYFVIHNNNFSKNEANKAFVKVDPGQGDQGSDGYAYSSSTANDFYLTRLITNVEIGKTYRASCATQYTSGTNHGPFNVKKYNDGVSVPGTYYNTGAQAGMGDGNWMQWSSPEFTIVSGANQVRLQHYRFSASNSIKVDNVLLEINSGISWSGTTSTDWNTTSNWVGGVVPTPSDHVLIPNVTIQPSITSNVEVTSLEIEEGADVIVTGLSTLTVSGQLTGNGTGYVKVMSGSSLIATRVQGKNHIIERQTRFSDGRYSIVGSPVMFEKFSALGAIIYAYDETIPYNSSIDNVSTGDDGLSRFIIQNTLTDTLSAGQGYFSASTGTVNFTGTPNTGNIAVALTYTDHDVAGTADENNFEGFNLVANPYPSALDYDMLIEVNGATAGSGVINESIWIWDDNESNTGRGDNNDYVTINALGNVGTESSVSSGLWDGFVRSGQGFFVKATGLGDLSFTTAMQVSGNNTNDGFYRESKGIDKETFTLSVLSKDAAYSNQTLIGMTVSGLEAIDHLDAQKLSITNGLKLFSIVNGQALAIQSIPMGGDRVIQLGLNVEVDDVYKLKISDMFNWGSGYSIILNDALTGSKFNLTDGDSYQFSATKGQSDRFTLSVSRDVLAFDDALNQLDISSRIDGIVIKSKDLTQLPIRLKLTDISGKLLLNKETSVKGSELTIPYDFNKNQIYILTVMTSSETITKKFIIK